VVAKAKGKLRAERKVVMTGMVIRVRICFINFSKTGVSSTRPLATGLMVTMKGFCYSTKSMGVARRSVLSTATAVEARDWAQKHEAGKYSIN
jgi:hypothetical protein